MDYLEVIGEGKPYLAAFVVLNPEQWTKLASEHGLDAASHAVLLSEQVEEIILERISAQIHAFPGYAQIRRAAVLPEALTIDNGLLTPTMKLRRENVLQAYQSDFDRLYAGH